MQLIQQVETSRMFGVEHFVFYVHSVSHSVLAALEYYKQVGVAEVQDWQYPPQMGDGVYFHQKTAVHDCLYRHTRTSRYLLFGDADEIFVPRSTGHLLPLLTSQFSEKPQCGSLQFLNTFYDINPHSKYDASALPDIGFIRHHNMTVLLRQERLNEIWPPRARSKLAVIPSRIQLLHVHFTSKFRGDYQECPLPSHQGLLQHYRTGLPGSLNKEHRPKALGFLPDPYLVNFAASIVRRVKTVLNDLGALGPDFNI
ncbi:glycosyltransferase family 92 protein F13G3.3-like [Littorina saxatilis]